jgi:6-phosphogluconolactonase
MAAFMVNPEIRVFPDAAQLNAAAAADILAVGRACQSSRETFRLVLAGGGTPVGVYALLAERSAADERFWQKTTVWWGDERCVDPEHAEANYRSARLALLARVPIPAQNVRRMPGERPDRENAAAEYAAGLPPRFDLLLAGVGADGHTLSLFPHSPAVLEQKRLCVATEGPATPRFRLTLTPAALRRADRVFVFIAGENKGEALRRTFAPDGAVEETPARLLASAEWFADAAACPKVPDWGECGPRP